MTDKPLLVSIKTAAEKLDCSKSKVRTMIRAGLFEIVQERRGVKGLRIVYSSIEAYVDGNKATRAE